MQKAIASKVRKLGNPQAVVELREFWVPEGIKIMKKIVSANYLDRNSSFPWLIREEGSPVESAKAFKSVKVKGFRFMKSREEVGFGCSVVAYCDEAEGFDAESKVRRLKFDGHDTFHDEDGLVVSRGQSLELNEDGSILASL